MKKEPNIEPLNIIPCFNSHKDVINMNEFFRFLVKDTHLKNIIKLFIVFLIITFIFLIVRHLILRDYEVNNGKVNTIKTTKVVNKLPTKCDTYRKVKEMIKVMDNEMLLSKDRDIELLLKGFRSKFSEYINNEDICNIEYKNIVIEEINQINKLIQYEK